MEAEVSEESNEGNCEENLLQQKQRVLDYL